ncbi:MAG: heme exporter protein CcmD [Alphaproteobacteria bacterium]|nr:heme exporter protein CcmD [Alphaproteobacteria bacterium]
MDHTPFIVGAYAVTLGGIAVLLLQSYIAMRRAEAEAERLRQERRR